MAELGTGLDIVLVTIGIGFAILGWRRGALVSVSSLVGLVFGFWVGGQVLAPLLKWLSARGGWAVDHRTALSVLVLFGCALILQAIAYAAGLAVRRRLGGGARGVDSLGGAIVSVILVGVAAWLAAGFLRTTPLMGANAAVGDSRVIAAIDRVAPIPPSRALASLGAVLQRDGFPRVFVGEPEKIAPINAPDAHITPAIRKASDSVVRVLVSASVCDRGSEGSGWVTTGNRVVTNAHVVAGARRIGIQTRGGGLMRQARLIAFDPGRDVAVLRVDGLDAQPLPLGNRLERGDAAIAAGYPGNGPFTYSPARVRQVVSAQGLDIYDSHTVRRDIYSLRASIRSGDSGGPLFDDNGRVAGMVFARSTTDPHTGYALTMQEIRSVLRASAGGGTVQSGACMPVAG